MSVHLPQTFVEYVELALLMTDQGTRCEFDITRLGIRMYADSFLDGPSKWLHVICAPEMQDRLMAEANTVAAAYTHPDSPSGHFYVERVEAQP